MIRHLLLGVASAAALAVAVPAAQAADLPAYEPAPAVAVPSFTWTGAYIGAQVGYIWGRASDMKNDGVMVGAYAGYNVQLDNSPVVFGIETDFNFSDQDGSKFRRGARTRLDSDWNGATRARLGYAFDRFLVYGAAGVAYSDREFKRAGSNSSKTAVGWTVGGGVEAAVTDNVVTRVEYRYTDYGSDNFRGGAKSSATEHRIMGGVAYKFNSLF